MIKLYQKQWTRSRNAVEMSLRRNDVDSSSHGTLCIKYKHRNRRL